MWKQLRAEVLFEAAGPIAHFEGTDGNHSMIAMTKVRRPKGGFAMVPMVSGNSMRNRMRFVSSMALLRAADMLGEKLSEPALRLLFNGGSYAGKGDDAPSDEPKTKEKGAKKKAPKGVANIDYYRELCELVPSLAIFGGVAGRIIEGKLQVGQLLLVCEESRAHLPEWIVQRLAEHEIEYDTARAHVERAQNVRMDSMLRPAMRTLLLPDAQVEATAKLLRADNAQAADESTGDADKSKMLPYTFERVARGSLFYWSCTVTVNSALEEDTFYVTLAELLNSGPVVGGKRGVDDHGQLRCVDARGIEVSREVRKADALDIESRKPGALFVPHVQERKERIAEFLRSSEVS
jgi:hypothetical protein